MLEAEKEHILWGSFLDIWFCYLTVRTHTRTHTLKKKQKNPIPSLVVWHVWNFLQSWHPGIYRNLGLAHKFSQFFFFQNILKIHCSSNFVHQILYSNSFILLLSNLNSFINVTFPQTPDTIHTTTSDPKSYIFFCYAIPWFMAYFYRL